MRRRLLSLLVCLSVGAAFDVTVSAPQAQQKQQRTQKAPQRQPEKAVAEPDVLHIYQARGEPDSCGDGCSEWIAIDGSFDAQSAGRVQAFLRRQGSRRLPVYFHSPGGSAFPSLAIGRELRARGFVTGVAMTVPRACADGAEKSKACRAAKQSQQPVEAEWLPFGSCNSACVYAFIGGRKRDVPPAARLGVHSARYTFTLVRRWSDGRVERLTEKQAPALQKSKLSELNGQIRRYVIEMGVDAALFDTAMKTPFESINVLTRDQIAAFGIDRREHETRWHTGRYVTKWIVQSGEPGRPGYRISSFVLRCATPRQAELVVWRGLVNGEPVKPAAFTFSFGPHKIVLVENRAAPRTDVLEKGRSYANSRNQVWFDTLDAAAATDSIQVSETDPWNSAASPRNFTLSTEGLAAGVKMLRETCAADPD